jgi:antitoxin VapB
MALSLEDPETDRLARKIAKLTGETLTEAVRNALIYRLARECLRRGPPAQRLADAVDTLARECAALPNIDIRSADEILGHDQNGMWH